MKNGPEFPITVRFEDGTVETYSDVEDIELNLEDFDSDLELDCTVSDRNGRKLRLVVSMLNLEELDFDPKTNDASPTLDK